MSAYRAPPAPEPERPKEVRRLVIGQLGTFGIGIWSGLFFVMGAVCVGCWQWANHEPISPRLVIEMWAGVAAIPLITALLLAATDLRVTFTARIEDGVLQIDERRFVGGRKHRSFAFRDIDRVFVDEHGEDLVAAFIRIGKKDHVAFATRIGDDARRVETFLDEGIAAWRSFTAGGDDPS